MDFQKLLLLLYCLDVEEEPPYEFVPYKYGGFSFTSYADKRRLMEQGLLVNDDSAWRLTSAGRYVATIDPHIYKGMENSARDYTGQRGDALVAKTYRRHPYYAIRSEIADRVLAGDRNAISAIDNARPKPQASGLWTIGYSNNLN